MLHNRIEGTTRTLGKSQGYLGLNIRDVVFPDGTQGMQSSWTPTPDELARLNNGGSLMLTVLGTGHPPVKLSVPE